MSPNTATLQDRAYGATRHTAKAPARPMPRFAGLAPWTICCLLLSCTGLAAADDDEAMHWYIRQAPADPKSGHKGPGPWLFYLGHEKEYDATGVTPRDLWTVLKAMKGRTDLPLAIVHVQEGAPQNHVDLLILCFEALGVREIRAPRQPADAQTPPAQPGSQEPPTPPAQLAQADQGRVADILAQRVQAQIAGMVGAEMDAESTAELARRVTTELGGPLSETARAIAAGQLSPPEVLTVCHAIQLQARSAVTPALRQQWEKTGQPAAGLAALRGRLETGAEALRTRGQDIADLTPEGLPAAWPEFDAVRCGIPLGLAPVVADVVPGYVADARVRPEATDRKPVRPPQPRKWGTAEQPHITPPFQSPRFEAIPFLVSFPRLDGDLSDWGKIRPLVLENVGGREGPPLGLWMGWNYQGFFLGYEVEQPGGPILPPDASGAAIREGDHLRLSFDTVNSWAATVGGWNAQEFVILPGGTVADAALPGAARMVASHPGADGDEVEAAPGRYKAFGVQPPSERGPDRSGPYRVTKTTAKGYAVEVFVPRLLFKAPAFCPGWTVGCNCTVAIGAQPKGGRELKGSAWVKAAEPNASGTWGDLLLLGTDPYLTVQEATEEASVATAVIPGHSYLVTVVDPDRNVHTAALDRVVVCAQVLGGKTPGGNDVEVFALKETGHNTAVFRGYINTQPGFGGHMVPGVIELLPGQELKLVYADLADAAGRRNPVFTLRLPVVHGVVAPAKGAMEGN